MIHMPAPSLPTHPPGLTLAQQGFAFIDPPAPPPLPRPPALAHYLLENPYPAMVLLSIAGVIAWRALSGAGRGRHAMIAAAACFLGAIAIFLAARSVETPREQLVRSTADLVASTARADVASMEPILAEQVSLFRPGGGPGIDKQEILSRVRETIGRQYRIKEWAILETQAMTDSGVSGVTQVRLRVTLEAAGIPNISWWKLDWRKAADGRWQVLTIDPVSVTPEVRGQIR